MRSRALLPLAVLAALAFAACDDGDTYPAYEADETYPLSAMALSARDLPADFESVLEETLDNGQTALLFNEPEADTLTRQMDAQGRLQGHIAVFLGNLAIVQSQSTLFTSVDAADQSLRSFCDLQQFDPSETTDFQEIRVPSLGDASTGLVVFQRGEGSTFVAQAVCFRTGRVVHSVLRSSPEGIENLAVTLQLAHDLLRRVDAAYEAIEDPSDVPAPTDDEGEG